MDLSSPSSQYLCDYDERFRIPSLLSQSTLSSLPATNETIYTHPFASLTFTRPLSYKQRINSSNNNDQCQELVEQLEEQYRQNETISFNSLSTKRSTSITVSDQEISTECASQIESLSNENNLHHDKHPLAINNDLQQKENMSIQDRSSNMIQDDFNRARDEFIRLLSKEACASKPSNLAKVQSNHHQRDSYDNNDNYSSLNHLYAAQFSSLSDNNIR